MNLTPLAQFLRRIFGLLPSGFEPFEIDNGTEVVGGLTMPARRLYPLPLYEARKPEITSRHKVHNPSRSKHYGVDLFYRWRAGDAAMKIGDGGRTKNWWVPLKTRVLAAADGTVEVAGVSKTGHRVWILHPGGLRTGYFHLSSLAVKPGEAVKAGTFLGLVGDNPADYDARHLHFEVYKGELKSYPKGTVDPEIFLKGAEYSI